jgi:putative transposase
VAWQCEALGVSRSGFHAWLTRRRSTRAQIDEALIPRIRASFMASARTYGARRVWRDLLADGLSCGLHKVERLMRSEALRGRPRRRGLPKDCGERAVATIAPNVLDRQFTAERPNQKWIADFTYIWTAEGWLYVAAVIDLFSRRVVGWSMKAEMTAQLVADALIMAIWRRGKPDALLHHSDQGSQYTSDQFRSLMIDHGIDCSMSRSGNVWDNAAMESFFSSLKTERVGRKVYRSRDDARADVFDYIERFYNTIRRHSTIGYVSPVEFERKVGLA